MTTLAERLRLLRGRTSRREFAAKIGISEGSLARYEQEGRLPSAEVIKDICRRLDIDAGWLLFGDDAPKTRNIDPSGTVSSSTSTSLASFKPDLEAIGKRIMSLRGLVTRLSYAEQMQVSPSSLARWEKGEAPPDLGFIVRMACRYGVTVEWLLTGAGNEVRPQADKQLAFLDGLDWPDAKGKNWQPLLVSSDKKTEHIENIEHEKNKTNESGNAASFGEMQSAFIETSTALAAATRETRELRAEIDRLNAEIQRLQKENKALRNQLAGQKPTASPSP